MCTKIYSLDSVLSVLSLGKEYTMLCTSICMYIIICLIYSGIFLSLSDTLGTRKCP